MYLTGRLSVECVNGGCGDGVYGIHAWRQSLGCSVGEVGGNLGPAGSYENSALSGKTDLAFTL